MGTTRCRELLSSKGVTAKIGYGFYHHAMFNKNNKAATISDCSFQYKTLN